MVLSHFTGTPTTKILKMCGDLISGADFWNRPVVKIYTSSQYLGSFFCFSRVLVFGGENSQVSLETSGPGPSCCFPSGRVGPGAGSTPFLIVQMRMGPNPSSGWDPTLHQDETQPFIRMGPNPSSGWDPTLHHVCNSVSTLEGGNIYSSPPKTNKDACLVDNGTVI